MLHNNLSVNELGHLCIGGVDTVTLAEKYKTALYVIDENQIRENARTYINAMKKYFGGESGPLFAVRLSALPKSTALSLRRE